MNEVDPRWYVFRNAVYERNYSEAESMLMHTPSLLSLTSGLGETALHYLAVENDLEGVAWLHAKGSSLDTTNVFGTPVIFEVAQLEYKELYSWFVANGANVRAHDKEGKDIIEYLHGFDVEKMALWVQDHDA